MPDYHIWFFAFFIATIIAGYFLILYYKDKDKRKLMFSLSILLSNLFFIAAFLGFIGTNIENQSSIWINITLLSSIPLTFAVFFAVNENLFNIRNFDHLFYIFLTITIICIALFFVTIDLSFFTGFLHQIIAVEILVASLYLFYKNRELVNLYFLLFIFCSIIAGVSFSFNLYLSAFAFVIGYTFIALTFIQPNIQSNKKIGMKKYFSLEQQLKIIEENYKQLFDALPDAITVLSEDGTILDCNSTMAERFKTNKEEIIGKNMHKLLPGDHDKNRTIIAQQALGTGNIQTNIDERNGIYLSNTYIPIQTGKRDKNLIIISRDITRNTILEKEKEEKIHELKKTELATLNILKDFQETINELELTKKQIADLNKNLEKKVEERTKEVKKLLKLKDDFIGQLGHDLKTPLTPLNTLLPIVYEQTKDKELKELLKILIHNVNYMKNLVSKTLHLAKLNSPAIKLDLEKTNLSEEINHVLEKKSFDFKTHNIEVENLVSNDVVIDADKLRIEELLDNIFSNAVKYSKEDGGKITIKTDETVDEIKLIIKDTGEGMNEKICKHIFDEFYKADESRHDFESTGLGLTICKKIIEHHGGRIWAESEGLGKGSTFFIAFNKKNIDDLKIFK